MPVILSVEDKYPQFGNNCFIAPNATIAGNVIAGDDCSFWFNTVLRGDVNFIRIGDKVNVQDGACIHCTFEKYGTTIGNNVSIGHHAIVHGCTLHDNVLIEPLEEELITKSGIVIPDTASKEKPMRGKILAVGPGKLDEHGKIHPLDVKKGDTVIFSKYAPTEIKMDGKELYILSANSVLAVEEGN